MFFRYSLLSLHQVSEKLDDNIEKLRVSVSLWEDVLAVGGDIDGWCSNSVSQLNDIISNLTSYQRTKAFLEEFQVTKNTHIY